MTWELKVLLKNLIQHSKACGYKGKAFKTKSSWHSCQKRLEQHKSIPEQDGIDRHGWPKWRTFGIDISLENTCHNKTKVHQSWRLPLHLALEKWKRIFSIKTNKMGLNWCNISLRAGPYLQRRLTIRSIRIWHLSNGQRSEAKITLEL